MEKELMKASIIAIGDELMIGQVTDTNSTFISQQLNREGIWVRRKIAVGDDRHEIRKALDEESATSKIILITGGLGPTADDITKPLLCDYFGMKLKTDEKVLSHVQHLFENVFKRPFTELNRKQAEVPDGCTVIHNPRGTAPGMWFEKNDVVYVSMPGVPHEMKAMLTDSVIPMLKKFLRGGTIIHKTLLTAGIGESALAEHINSWEGKLPAHIKLAYLPNYGMVRLRLTSTGFDARELESEISDLFNSLQHLVKEWLVTSEDISLAEALSKLVRSKKKTLATAESCTGGYIAHLITSLPGSSDIFKGAVVSYANEVKSHVLHVNESTLSAHGAVSEQTVTEMVRGALEALATDYCIATSGIMGPTGGTPEKPVGTVWVAVGSKEKVVTHKFNLRYDRMRNIEITAAQALNLMRKFVQEGY